MQEIRNLGVKQYELTDHLGNVSATVLDRKNGYGSVLSPVHSATAIYDYAGYYANLANVTDYYPFGMVMPGRSKSFAKYRMGYNGKENDDEVYGKGNFQDYGMRMYDARIARFPSVDPLVKSYRWYTPYQFAGNTPIQAIDLDGAEEFHYTMTINKQGTADLKLTKTVYGYHHSYLFGFINTYTKINVKRYVVDFNLLGKGSKTYYIGFSLYGKGYANAWKADEFEKDYVKQKGDPIAFYYGYVDENHSNAMSTGFYGTNAQNKIAEAAPPSAESISINPQKIRFSQSTVNGVGEIESSMRTNGWRGAPIDVVKMDDGAYTTVDNTRILAAQNSKINVQAIVHNFDDPIPSEQGVRFVDKKGVVPKTWGQAVQNRVNNQSTSFKSQGENGSYTQPRAKN